MTLIFHFHQSYTILTTWVTLHSLLLRVWLHQREGTLCWLCGFRYHFLAEEMRHMASTSTALSKTDVHKQTKWQQTSGGKGWGRYCTRAECFHVSCPCKWELFPRCASYGRILPMTWSWLLHRPSVNLALMESLFCYTPWFFYCSWDTAAVCVLTGMDGNSLWLNLWSGASTDMPQFSVFNKICNDYKLMLSTCDVLEVRPQWTVVYLQTPFRKKVGTLSWTQWQWNPQFQVWLQSYTGLIGT